MMKKLLFLLPFLFANFFSGAQTVVLEQEVEEIDTLESMSGPNKGVFIHPVYGAGLVLGQSDPDAEVTLLRSGHFFFGTRIKGKITNVYSIGGDIIFRNTNFRFSGDSAVFDLVPSAPAVLDKEKFSFWMVGLELFNRINFDPKRGNYMGTYLDLGAGAGYNFSIKYKVAYEDPLIGRIKTSVTKLDFPQRYQAYALARYGKNNLAIKATYRFTELFNDRTGPAGQPVPNPQLPQFTASLELGLF